MTRLLLRISLGIFAASALMLVSGHLIFSIWARRTMETSPPSVVVAAMDGLQARLASLEGVARDRELQRLRTTLKSDVRVLHRHAPEIPIRTHARLDTGLSVVAFDGTRPSIYVPLAGEQVLVAGPFPGMEVVHPWIIVLVLGTSILVVGLTGFFLSAWLVRRLRRLERAAVSFGQGDLSARALPDSRDALGSLARRFNDMAQRLQRLIENQRLLLQAVSHELRTPTARIRFGLEMLAGATTETEKQERIASIDDDLAELDDLVQELLVFNRFEDGAAPRQIEPIPVASTVREIADRLEHLGTDLRLTITDQQPPCEVACDLRAFGRAMQNLLQNAMRYAASEVTVACRREDQRVVLELSDDGPGIPDVDRQRVLEPFARVEDSRSRESGGAGLGLAIVQRIVTAHGGSITIDQTEAGGARVITSWPAV